MDAKTAPQGVTIASDFAVAAGMEPEDGVIWVYGIEDEGVMAFTDFGIENLVDLIKMYKDDPTLLHRDDGK